MLFWLFRRLDIFASWLGTCSQPGRDISCTEAEPPMMGIQNRVPLGFEWVALLFGLPYSMRDVQADTGTCL